MIVTIPLDAVPNQTVQVQITQETWEVTVETRLGELYLSLSNRTDGIVLLNRVCRDRTLMAGGFFFCIMLRLLPLPSGNELPPVGQFMPFKLAAPPGF